MPPHDSIQEALEPHFAKLESLLRLLTPDHPMQPMLGESISLLHCQSSIFEECHRIAEIGERYLSGYENSEYGKTIETNQCRRTLAALAVFAGEHLTAAHFFEFPEDLPEGASPDEFVRADFLDTDEFFLNDHLWNLRHQVWEHREAIKERIEKAESLWKEINETLKKVLLKPIKNCSLSAYDAFACNAANLRWTADELADVLQRLSDGSYRDLHCFHYRHRKQRAELVANARSEMVSEVEQVLHAITKTLGEIIKQLLPSPQEKDLLSANRSRRQQIRKQITSATTTWLLRSRVIRGWELLKQEAQRTIELRVLLQNCKNSVEAIESQISKTHCFAKEPPELTYAALLQDLKQLPLKVIDPKTLDLWERGLRDEPELAEWIIKGLQLHCRGMSAFGAPTLRNSIFNETLDAEIEKRDKTTLRKLHDLAAAKFAMQGSRNWVPFKDDKTRNLTPDQGWGINPIVVLLEPVNKLLQPTN